MADGGATSHDRELDFLKVPEEEQEKAAGRKSAASADEVRRYQEEIASLTAEVHRLRHHAAQARRLEELLLRSSTRPGRTGFAELLQETLRRNESLTAALEKARAEIEALRQELDKLTSPPSAYATYLRTNEDGTLDVLASGRRLKVNASGQIDLNALQPGQQLVLNDALNVVGAADYEVQGEVVKFKERLDSDRAVVSMRADEERVVNLSGPLRSKRLKPGDNVLLDSRSGYLLEKLPGWETEDFILEEVPQVTYDSIGALSAQIEALRDAVELPYLYPEEYERHRLSPPKGVLLYGPPGCGKTLLAKALANSLAKRTSEKTGKHARSYFLNIKGPELLNKYVGETERLIREIFRRARERASSGMPVIIFFDEMDALFRMRGTGISSDVESSIVPQLLSEIDGMEGLRNVIVIGASNRQDLIDPGVLRPGRMNIKIKVDRPDAAGALDIFRIYLSPDIPIDRAELESAGSPDEAVHRMAERAVAEIFDTSQDKRFLEVTYASGEREVLYFKDFASGAMIENIVSRAKKMALKRFITSGQDGIRTADLIAAVREEFKENEDLPNTTNPDDWVKISGRRGARIVHVRALSPVGETPKRVETVMPGHYL